MVLQHGSLYSLMWLLVGGAFFAPPLVLGQASAAEISVGGSVDSDTPFVVTKDATGVTTIQATLQGELATLGDEPEADVFFQYREQGEAVWEETARQTKLAAGDFSSLAEGLSPNTAYEFRAGAEWDSEQAFGATLEFTTLVQPQQGKRRSLPTGSIVFEGFAYPGAFGSIVLHETAIATFVAEHSGIFSKEATLEGGVYTFSIRARDSEGRESAASTFTIGVLPGMTNTVSRIFLAPTISLSAKEIPQGGPLTISGQSFPGGVVRLFLAGGGGGESLPTVSAGQDGKWAYQVETSAMSFGEKRARARSLLQSGEQSPFSQTETFFIVPSEPCAYGDLNGDGEVNMADLSILLFWWERDRACPDQNDDGIVDMVDVAILLYWWTG